MESSSVGCAPCAAATLPVSLQVGGTAEHALLACVTPAPGPSSEDGSSIVASGAVSCGVSAMSAVGRYL
eukprot:11113294-Prorocentrum_lima.AAC.1